MKQIVARQPRLQFEYLPPYAPELNLVEQVWSHLKRNPLANQAAQSAAELAVEAQLSLRRIRGRPSLLRFFLKATRLLSCPK